MEIATRPRTSDCTNLFQAMMNKGLDHAKKNSNFQVNQYGAPAFVTDIKQHARPMINNWQQEHRYSIHVFMHFTKIYVKKLYCMRIKFIYCKIVHKA